MTVRNGFLIAHGKKTLSRGECHMIAYMVQPTMGITSSTWSDGDNEQRGRT